MSAPVWIREMLLDDIPKVVALQELAFPPPFDQNLLWVPEHLVRHIEVFPEGQLVADCEGAIIGSCSNTIVSEHTWRAHGNWNDTVGGPELHNFAPEGTTLYGLDISVHPEHRKQGHGRRFYQARFELVTAKNLKRYGTACRMPDYRALGREKSGFGVQEYAQKVVNGELIDRTLTPLLRYGLSFQGVIEDYMEDDESGNAGALLEWLP